MKHLSFLTGLYGSMTVIAVAAVLIVEPEGVRPLRCVIGVVSGFAAIVFSAWWDAR